jgi:hypothetical protein
VTALTEEEEDSPEHTQWTHENTQGVLARVFFLLRQGYQSGLFTNMSVIGFLTSKRVGGLYIGERRVLHKMHEWKESK